MILWYVPTADEVQISHHIDSFAAIEQSGELTHGNWMAGASAVKKFQTAESWKNW